MIIHATLIRATLEAAIGHCSIGPEGAALGTASGDGQHPSAGCGRVSGGIKGLWGRWGRFGGCVC